MEVQISPAKFMSGSPINVITSVVVGSSMNSSWMLANSGSDMNTMERSPGGI